MLHPLPTGTAMELLCSSHVCFMRGCGHTLSSFSPFVFFTAMPINRFCSFILCAFVAFHQCGTRMTSSLSKLCGIALNVNMHPSQAKNDIVKRHTHLISNFRSKPDSPDIVSRCALIFLAFSELHLANTSMINHFLFSSFICRL